MGATNTQGHQWQGPESGEADYWTQKRSGWFLYRDGFGGLYESREAPAYHVDLTDMGNVNCLQIQAADAAKGLPQ